MHTIGRKTRQSPSAAHKAAAPQSSSGRGAAAGRNAYGAVGWCNVVPEDPFTVMYRNAERITAANGSRYSFLNRLIIAAMGSRSDASKSFSPFMASYKIGELTVDIQGIHR